MVSAICHTCNVLSSDTKQITQGSWGLQEKSDISAVWSPWVDNSGGPSFASSGDCSSLILLKSQTFSLWSVGVGYSKSELGPLLVFCSPLLVLCLLPCYDIAPRLSPCSWISHLPEPQAKPISIHHKLSTEIFWCSRRKWTKPYPLGLSPGSVWRPSRRWTWAPISLSSMSVSVPHQLLMVTMMSWTWGTWEAAPRVWILLKDYLGLHSNSVAY
jgi:hypothetical protein